MSERPIRLSWYAYLALAVAGLLMACGLWLCLKHSPASALPPEPPFPSAVSFGSVDQMIDACADPYAIDLVSFQPVLLEGRGRYPGIDTILIGEDKLEHLDIHGTFALVERLYLFDREAGPPSSPQQSGWGYVQQAPVVSLRWAGDAKYRHLRALEVAGTQPGTHLLLAICPQLSNAALDATFIGPLRRSERAGLAEFVALARSAKKSPLTRRQAEELLGSKSPWLAWFGLHRLKKLGCLAPRHFAQALRTRDPAAMEDAIREAILTFRRNAQGQSFTAELLFTGLDPEQRKQALAAARALYAENFNDTRGFFRLADWQAAASAHRDTILGDPAKADIVHELDLILALKKSPLGGEP